MSVVVPGNCNFTDFSLILQVMKCMKLLKEQKILATISSALESVLGLDGKTLVPSKQYLEFMLVKIIGK